MHFVYYCKISDGQDQDVESWDRDVVKFFWDETLLRLEIKTVETDSATLENIINFFLLM